MRVVQTKQNSQAPSRNTKYSPSIHDLSSPGVGSVIERRSTKQGNKLPKTSTNTSRQHSHSPPHYASPLTPKVPNLDLIEDVNRASQTLAHELINTHNANLPSQQTIQLIAIVDPMYSEPESPLDTDTPLTAALKQNAAIVFHRGSPRYLMNDAIMPAPNPAPGRSPTTSIKVVNAIKRNKHQRIANAKAAQASNPVSVMVSPISEEDRFKMNKTGMLSSTNKNSFERASKQYYLHQ